MCRLSGHYKPRLMTIAAKRLSPHSPSQPHLHVRVRLQLASHRVPHRKPTDNDDNNRTFSHLQLKAGRVQGNGGTKGVGECVVGFVHWKAAVVSVPWALCVLRHIKRHPAVLSGFGLCRVQQVSVFSSFFFCQIFIFCLVYDIFIFCSFDCIVYCSAP